MGFSTEKIRSREKQSIWSVALHMLNATERGTSLLDLDLSNTLRDFGLNDLDRKLAERIVKGVLENRAWLDSQLSTRLSGNFKTSSLELKQVLRIGSYQIVFLTRFPREVAVNETVNLAKMVLNGKQAKLVNAILRRLIRDGVTAPRAASKLTPESLALECSHPLWLVNRWIAQIGLDQTAELCRYNNVRWPLALRRNSLKANFNQLSVQLEAYSIRFEQSRYLDDCFKVVELKSSEALFSSELFQSGLIIVQDESSCLCVRAVAPSPGEFIIDLCAAPGGKTVYLASLMNNTGRILAVDPNQERLNLVKENCARLGVTIVDTLCADGLSLKVNNLADKVLVDAPCSGLGTLGRKKDIRWNRSLSQLQKLPQLQLGLLTNAAGLVRVGGKVIYTTCSVDQAENEAVVESFLREQPSFSRSIPEAIPQRFLTENGDFRSWPHRDQMAGAYASVLERLR